MSHLSAVFFTFWICLGYQITAQNPKTLQGAVDDLEATYSQINDNASLIRIDSLLTVSRIQKNPKLEVRLLILRLKIPSWQYQIDKVLVDLDQRLMLAKAYNTEPLAEIYQSKATYEGRRGDIDATWRMLDSVELYLYELTEDERVGTQAQVYYLKGRMLDRVGKLEEAVKMYQLCIDEAEKIDYDLKIMDVYFQLGFVQNLMGNLEQSLKSYQKSLEYSLDLQDTSYTVYNLVFIAGNYNTVAWDQEGKQKEESLTKAKSQLDFAQTLVTNESDAYVLELLYYEMAQYFAVSDLYAEAIKYIELCREETGKTSNSETKIPTYYLASNCFFKMGQYQKALDEAVLGITLSKEKASFNNLRNLYQSAGNAAEKLGNINLALQYSKKFIAANDSISRETMIKSINELQTKYETEKKEAEIVSLSQKASIQELEIQQRNQTIFLGLVFFILLAITAYFLYYRQTSAKKRKQIELEQRFLRSQLNPHFISNALVTVQNSLYEKNTEMAETYLETFSRLMREILENSRKEYIPLANELSMLRDYLEINKQRLEDAFDYEIQVNEALDEEMDEIPPMFIQPFVENAIEHGLKTTESGRIKIALFKEGDLIKVLVEDNGPGISSGITSSRDKKSLSTSIIQDRMDLYNRSLKNKISLLIENIQDASGNNAGTRIQLHIPVR